MRHLGGAGEPVADLTVGPVDHPGELALVGRFQSSNHISGLETPGFTGPKRMLDMSGFMESVV